MPRNLAEVSVAERDGARFERCRTERNDRMIVRLGDGKRQSLSGHQFTSATFNKTKSVYSSGKTNLNTKCARAVQRYT